jgi:ElaB/YqjD/DUF883 family membrane-anchored ribosome-binding protein
MTAIIEKMADDLARDAIEAADAMDDEELVMDLGKMLASSSTTAEEAYLTAARVRMALARARKHLEDRIDAAASNIGSHEAGK